VTPSLNLRLSHDGERWLGRASAIEVSASTLSELDVELIDQIRVRRIFAPGTELQVQMRYDFASFPSWLRQYHSHYFNRRVRLQI
jgi:hypothetical protein